MDIRDGKTDAISDAITDQRRRRRRDKRPVHTHKPKKKRRYVFSTLINGTVKPLMDVRTDSVLCACIYDVLSDENNNKLCLRD